MFKSKNMSIRFVAICVLALLLLCISVSSGIIRLDCDERGAKIPQVPIYPGSTLMRHVVSVDTDSAAIINYAYEVQNTFEDVAEFYSQNATCSLNAGNNTMFCYGDTKPFGKFMIGITNTGTPATEYWIEVLWDRCSSGWEESIE